MASSDRLGITWFNGVLTGTIYRSGRAVSTRSWSEPVTASSQLLLVISELVKGLGFQGEEVSVVASLPSMGQFTLKPPPMKPNDLQQFIERKAKQEWAKPEPVSYAWTKLKNPKEERSVLVHLAPADVVMGFATALRRSNLQLCHFLTAPAAIPYLLQSRSAGSGLKLVAASTGSSTLVCIGSGPGEAMLVRELSYAWSTPEAFDSDRVSRELHRSILFAKQQFGASVDQLVLLGRGAQGMQALVKEITGLEPQTDDEFVGWCQPFLGTEQKRTDTLVPKDVLGHNSRRRLSEVAVMATLAFLALASGTKIGMHYLLHRIQVEVDQLGLQVEKAQLEVERQRLEAQLSRIDRFVFLRNLKEEHSLTPVAGWAAGLVADVIPDNLRLGRLLVDKIPKEGWTVVLEGDAPRHSVRSADLLQEFQARLESGPSQMGVHIPWDTLWLENLKQGSSKETDEDTKPFKIMGRIR